MVNYADDITLCAPIFKNSVESPLVKYSSFYLRGCLKTMSLRRDKSQQLFINKNVSFDSFLFALQDIPVHNCMKFLGVFLDDKLSWKFHVNFIVKKASPRMWILRQLKPFMTNTDLVLQVFLVLLEMHK